MQHDMRRRAWLVVLTLTTALLYAAMVAWTWPLDPGIPALQMTFTEGGFRRVLAQWSSADLERFRLHFLIDYPFLFCYGLLGFKLSTRTKVFARWPRRHRAMLTLALPVAAMADIVENLIHLGLLNASATAPGAIYLVAGIASTIKWSLVVVFVLALPAAWLRRMR